MHPAVIALRGMLSCWAESSCAKVIPPSALMALHPAVPSFAVPENDRNRLEGLLGRQALKEVIDRAGRPVGTVSRNQSQDTPGQLDAAVGRNHVDMIPLRDHIVLDGLHREVGGPGKNLREHAGVIRREMVHQDERHPGVFRQGLEKKGRGLQPSGRCPHTNDGKGEPGFSGRRRDVGYRALDRRGRLAMLRGPPLGSQRAFGSHGFRGEDGKLCRVPMLQLAPHPRKNLGESESDR